MGEKPFELLAQQRALHQALLERHAQLACCYLGALRVLEDGNNPDGIALAAHGMRELMEKLPEYLDVPMKALKESLKVKVIEVENHLSDAQAKSKCHDEGSWRGEIDPPLKSLLDHVTVFFTWFKNHHPRRKAEASRVLRTMDPSGRYLPPPLEDLNVSAWQEMWDFYKSVAHHRRQASRDDFRQWVDALERFLLDRMIPRTFDDMDAIDAIVNSAKRDD